MKRIWLINLVTFVAIFLVCSAWSLATPISSGPDESGHIMKAAASARGIWTGTPTDRAGIESFSLPADVADVGGPMTCTAFHPELSAACAPSFNDASASEVLVETGVGSYNPVYYVLVGWPTLFLTGEPAIYGMRLASALLSASLLAAAFAAARALTGGSRYVQAALMVALTPMVYFLGGVINPNGAETAGTAAFVTLLWLVLVRAQASPIAIAALVAATAFVANLRATSPLYLLLAALAVITAVGWPRSLSALQRKRVLIGAIVAVVLAAFGALWTLRIGLGAGFIPSSGLERDDPITAFGTTLAKSTDYGRQIIGVFGWLDTLLPDWIYALWAALVGAVLVGALALTSGRRLAALLISVTALAFVPALIQAPSTAAYGYIWQGRYSLPLFVTMILVAGISMALSVNGSSERIARRVLVLIASLTTIAQCAAFVVAMHRYTVGSGADLVLMFTAPAWLPPGGMVVPMALCAIGTVGLGCLVLLPVRQGGGADASVGTAPTPNEEQGDLQTRPRRSTS